MYRSQIDRYLTHDERGETLEPSETEERLISLFGYYSCSWSDVIYECTVAFSIDVNEWLRNCDRYIVFLAKHGNLPPDWTERQDITRLNKLLREVCDMIKAANTPAEPTTADKPREWQ